MKIIRLSISNIRKIQAAELDFEGRNMVEIRGKNGAGKSTVIDSLLYLFKGGSLPDGLVTADAEKGEIVGYLDNYTIRKVIKEDGKASLSVKDEQGAVARPQEFLDKLAGKFLDPEYFRNLPGMEKRQLVLKYAGVDFSGIEKRVEIAESNRRFIGQELKALGKLPQEPEKVQEQSAAELFAERKAILDFNYAQLERQRIIENKARNVRDAIIKKLQADVKNFDDLSFYLKRVYALYQEELPEYLAGVEQPEKEKPLGVVDIQIAGIETSNKKARAYKEWEEKKKAIDDKQAEYDAADAEVDRLRKEKLSMADGAAMPLEGLAVTETGLAFNGVSDQNWSDSEALKIALNIAVAYSGDLKAVYIKRGEALDGASLQKLREFAEGGGFQIIVEVVDDSYAGVDDGVIWIEDGSVVSGKETKKTGSEQEAV
jgi:hypothetical protein